MSEWLLMVPTNLLATDLEPPTGWTIFFYSGVVFVIIAFLVFAAVRGLNQRIPRNIFTQCAEQLYHFMEGLCLTVIGQHGRKYVPFLMALWIYIITANLVGLILPHTPSADWSLNLSLSIITLIYVQYEGIKTNGVWGHITHFAGPRLPVLMAIFMTPLIFGIEIISEFMKVITLSLRLFLNMDSGHLIVTTLDNLVGSGQWPVGAVLFPIKLLACIIQAYVFIVLTCVYFALVTTHVEDDTPQVSEHNLKHV